MSKYDDLKIFLISSNKSVIKLSFSEIENILNSTLPRSAYVHTAWWANDNSHCQSKAWISAGYSTKNLNLAEKSVCFCKTENTSSPTPNPHKDDLNKTHFNNQYFNDDILSIYGYEFHFIQKLIPECTNGNIKEYFPQEYYQNAKNLPLLPNGDGVFCRFSINAPNASGVYLWVADEKIIYIGETTDLSRRFNTGYGCISPRNCYAGGQSTNCKMNKVVMEQYRLGSPVKLYFYETKIINSSSCFCSKE